ncbi:MAG: VOC family protein [Hyphomonadaceae bacterium]|jgi:catechol 2,3-dioxygenase-like lactoylglutathione lyase family enzyme|nr:VOC family protein [Hyphomonadaceae bacterium]
MTDAATMTCKPAPASSAAANIEHVNLTVSDTGATARLLMDLFGWHVRWEEDHPRGGHVIHVGTGGNYIALYQPSLTPGLPRKYAKGMPLNHVGVQVADLAATRQKVIDAGLTPFNDGSYDPGPDSFYFYDPDGIEWEVVSYGTM